jgi:hypothetical protein
MAPQQAGQAFPNFSLAVLGDFNGLGAKKFGDARPSRILFIRAGRRQHRTCQSGDYNRGRAFAEEIVWLSACKLLT